MPLPTIADPTAAFSDTRPALALTKAAPRFDTDPRRVGDRIVQFRDPAHKAEPLTPFPALIEELRDQGSGRGITPVRPRFRDRGSIREITIDLQESVDFYGTGEVAGPLRRNGRQATLWNSDSFAYSDKTPSIYQSQPFVLGVRADGTAFGVICRTTWRCKIDLASSGMQIVFRVGGTYRGDSTGRKPAHRGGIRPPSPAIVVIERNSAEEVVKALAELTGTMSLPPLWALGYHQCRWSYNPDSRVLKLAQDFREKKMPCDVIWMDIDYMDGFRCFTFDKEQFPNPRKLNDQLHALGFHTVWMIDPGLKIDPDYSVFAAGLKGDHYVKTAAGENYSGKVWPGPCHFPDFTRARTRQWWAGLYKDYMATGIDGVWNDMNEPAVFDVPGKTMPDDNHHDADAELGGPGPHAAYHNIYGLQMVRASREGIQAANPDKRPFVLTRANFLGGHRYAATWTGDNVSDWTHLRWSISMILNLGLTGQPLAGPDMGGFMGNATPELFGRWAGIASLLPFSRGHSVKESVDHEPWSFGAEVESICRLALERRYRLLPYLYTLAREASISGLPIARPMFFADPTDPSLRGVDDQFLLGRDVLVRCHVLPGARPATDTRPLPDGWRAFEPASATSTELPDLFVRPGAIVPMGPSKQFIAEKPLDPLTLVICPDEHGVAEGELYEDAGEGFGYRKGEYLKTTYHCRVHAGGKNADVTIKSHEGSMPRPSREVQVIVLLPEGAVAKGSGHDGKTIHAHA